METCPEVETKAAYVEKPVPDFIATHKENPDSTLDRNIAWRFKHMDKSGIGKCTLKQLHDYHDTLVDLEKITLRELKSRSHNHEWDIKDLDPAARKRADTLNIEEEMLFQIKLGDKPRLYGIWEENIFHILWLDKNHDKIYKCKSFNS